MLSTKLSFLKQFCLAVPLNRYIYKKKIKHGSVNLFIHVLFWICVYLYFNMPVIEIGTL